MRLTQSPKCLSDLQPLANNSVRGAARVKLPRASFLSVTGMVAEELPRVVTSATAPLTIEVSSGYDGANDRQHGQTKRQICGRASASFRSRWDAHRFEARSGACD